MSEKTKLSNEEDVDFREILVYLWQMKLWIVLSGMCFLSVSIFYAFFIAKPLYESTALLIPTQTSANTELSAAASLIGKGQMGTNDVDLYQGLLTSRAVISKLLKEPMPNKSDTGKDGVEPLISILGHSSFDQNLIENYVSSLSNSISVSSKGGDGGIVKVKFSANAPWLAQQIGENVLKIGQEEFRQVRIERSKVIIARLNIAVATSSKEWELASRELANYKDRNRSITFPDQIMALSKLEIEKQAKEQKYLLVRRELETQIIEQAKAVPPMMILDPPNFPTRKSKPKRGPILVMGLIFGLIFGGVSVLTYKGLARVR